MLAALLFLFLAPDSQGQVQLRHLQFYDILKKESGMDCRYLADSDYGFRLTRASDDVIQAELISSGKLEGESSRFQLAIKTKAAIGLHLFSYERKGPYGRFVEIELRNQVNPRLGYKFPGLFMQTSALFTIDEEGNEKETRYPDQMRRVVCTLF